MWQTTTSRDIWSAKQPEIDALLHTSSLLDDSAAIPYMYSVLEPFSGFGYGRHFAIASANVDTGDYEIFTRDNVSWEEIPHAAMASGSIPVVFPP